MSTTKPDMEKIVALCKRRGFIFQSSEIYGGIGGFWDYGPLGTELKRNVKDAWWNDMVRHHPPGPESLGSPEYDIVGVDCSIIMNPKVWEASGHVGGFSDPMVDCKECNGRFRADQVYVLSVLTQETYERLRKYLLPEHDENVEMVVSGDVIMSAALEGDSIDDVLGGVGDALRAAAKKQNIASLKKCIVDESTVVQTGNVSLFQINTANQRHFVWGSPLASHDVETPRTCPRCQQVDTLTEPRDFNLMFESHTGAVKNESAKVYLRPETAQGIFVNFKNVLDSTRVRPPFGIAQIGKAFRNEINPRNYTFRSREFEQYELEFFCHPSEADAWYEYWRDLRHQWYVSLGLKSDMLRLREHEGEELAHYAKGCADIEYDFPFGVSELEGIANRTDFDLKAHIDASRKDLSYFDDQRKERYVPYVIEPSGGVDRSILAFICEAYSFDENRASPEFLKFHPRLAPIKAAVFPLVAKDGMPDIAEPIYREIKKQFPCQYDPKQSIGKRYARMDEAGTPFCFTIDGQTKEDGTVTVRNRDDASQIRIDKSRCAQYLSDKLAL